MAYRKTEFVERKRLETRARIVSAAADLVRSRGWRGCVLKAVAENAGVATGSIYTHFEKITDLYQEAYSVIAEEELEVLLRVAERKGPATERLQSVVDAFTGRALRGAVQAYAMIGEPVHPDVEQQRMRFSRRFAEPVEIVLRDGVASGEFVEQDPVVSAACIFGAIIEAMVSPLAPEAMAQQDRGRGLRRQIRNLCLRAAGVVEPSASSQKPPAQNAEA